MEKILGNTHVFVLSCKFLTCKHKNMRVSMYFLHLKLTFTPHYIITDKGLRPQALPNAQLVMHVRLCCIEGMPERSVQ